MLVIRCIQLYLCWSHVSGSTLDLLREACPYTNLCILNGTKTYRGSDEYMPCCYDCFCDANCDILGDCCPDFEQPREDINRTLLPCKQVGSVPELYKDIQLPRYRIIDYCPANYMTDIEILQRCEDSEKYVPKIDDIILVSDQNGVLYKNKFCASCNGIQKSKRWDLVVVLCWGNMATTTLTIAEAQQYFIENCVLTSSRPSDVPITSRTLECIDAVCPNDIQDEKLVKGCINGPYMPYVDVSNSLSLGFTIFKNYHCFKCNENKLGAEICPALDPSVYRLSTISFQMFLNMTTLKMESSRPALDGCAESELLDSYTGHCKKVFCPPFQVVSYGTCISYSRDIPGLTISTHILYTLQDDSIDLIVNQTTKYNNTVDQFFVNQLRSKYGTHKCNTFRFYIVFYSDKQTKRFFRLVLQIVYKLTSKCTLQHITEHITGKIRSAQYQKWLLNGKMVLMKGRLTFHEDVVLLEDPAYKKYVLMENAVVGMAGVPLNAFFLCPYFNLNQTEYMSHVKRMGKVEQEYGLASFKPSSRYLAGFYPLSKTVVAVCIDTYLYKNDACFKRQIHLWLPISLLVIYLLK